MSYLKTSYLIVIFILFHLSASSQIKSGPIIGIAGSWLEKGNVNGNSYGTQYGEKDGKWKSQVSFQVGYQFLFPLKNNFVLNASILYLSRGLNVAYNNSYDDKIDESKRLNALSANGMINYYLIKKIPFGVGIEPTYYFNTEMANNSGNRTTFDIPVVMKIGYDFGIMEVALLYKHGFKSIYRNHIVRKTASRDIEISLFYPISF